MLSGVMFCCLESCDRGFRVTTGLVAGLLPIACGDVVYHSAPVIANSCIQNVSNYP